MKTGTKIGWALVAVAIFISVWVLAGGIGKADSASDPYGNTYEITDGVLTGVSITSDHAEIPGSVNKIADGVFAGQTGLTTVSATSVKEIGSGAFQNCSSLTSLTLSTNLEKIGDSAFANCTNFVEVVIPSSVSYISGNAFSGCSNLARIDVSGSSYYKSDNGVIYSSSGTELLICPPKALAGSGEYYIIPGCAKVNTNAFSGNQNIQILHIPASVTDWGDQANFMPLSVKFAENISETAEAAIRATFNNGTTTTEPEGGSPGPGPTPGSYSITSITENADGTVTIKFSGPDVDAGSLNGIALDSTNGAKDISSGSTVITLYKAFVDTLRPASGSQSYPLVLNYGGQDYNGTVTLTATPTPPPTPAGHSISPTEYSMYNTDGAYAMVVSNATPSQVASVQIQNLGNIELLGTGNCSVSANGVNTQIVIASDYIRTFAPGSQYVFKITLNDGSAALTSKLKIKTTGGGGGGGGGTTGGGTISGGGTITGGGTISGGGTVSNLYGNGSVTSGTTTASSTTGTTHTKDATPTTADGWDARLAFAIAMLLAGVVVLMLSRRNAAKLETIRKDRE